MMRRFLALLLCLLILVACSARAEFPGADGDVQAWLDLPPVMGAGAEWHILALSHEDGYDFAACQGALLDALAAASPAAHTTRLKYALVLKATGSSAPVIAQTLADSAGQQGVMSHVYALHLLSNGVAAPGLTPEATVQTLLALQLPDGGWALRGTVSDPDVTAMVLQSLAPHASDTAVAAAIDAALARLSALQRPEGDYASFGTPNPESTAQVIIALAALGIDPAEDPRFIRDGVTLLDGMARYRLPNGSYSHTLGGPSNANATTQAFLALSAVDLLHAGRGGLYMLPAASADAAAAPASPGDAAGHTAPLPWRLIAAGCVVLAALIGMAVILLQKRPWKNCIAIAVIAATLIALICTLDMQSADSYYTGRLPEKPDAIGTVTLTIRCDAALRHPDAANLPADGVILPPTEMPIAPGDTVHTLLTEAARAFGIHLESSGPDGMRYVQGVANLYEFSLGDLSGWLYRVNGESPSLSCDQYAPSPGDRIEWLYTLEMGGDLD